MASLLPGLRRAAPRLSREFFVCRQCIKETSPATRPWVKVQGQSTILRNSRFNSTISTPQNGVYITTKSSESSPLHALSGTIAEAKEAKSSRFPKTSSKSVAYWLLGSAASVFGIVVFGGLTRLTESGYAFLTYAAWPSTNTTKVSASRNGNQSPALSHPCQQQTGNPNFKSTRHLPNIRLSTRT
jgi:hypothetical protein